MEFLKRATAVILSAVMILGAGTAAEAAKTVRSTIKETKNKVTSTGKNVWSFNKKTGEIKFEKLNDLYIIDPFREVEDEEHDDEDPGEFLPWYKYKDQVKTATFSDKLDCIESTVCMNMINLTKVNIPSSIKRIGSSAFALCKKLEKIDIPESVEEIGDSAFLGTNLKSIKLPSKITSIGDKTFFGCDKLESIEIPDKTYYIGRWAFIYCNRLREVKLPESLGEIDEYAFGVCPSLESIHIPDNVTYLGYGAFDECEKLRDIKIGSGLEAIGEKAFKDTAYYNDKSNWQGRLLYLDNYLINSKKSLSGDCVIKDGTTLIADGTFSDCKMLESLSFPASLKYIGDDNFNTNGKLSVFKISDVAAWCSVKMSAFNTFFEKALLVNNVAVDELVIPEGVETINVSVFSGCNSFKKLSVASTVKTIDYMAFMGCDGLESVTINEGVECIGSYAFYECKNLKSVTIPKSVKDINIEAFAGTPRKLVISGYADTAAQKCAKKYGARFANLDTGKTTDYSKKNPISVTVSTASVKAEKLRKSGATLRPVKVAKAKGSVTYALEKKGTSKAIYSKITLTKSGSIKLKKGACKTGTYKVKLRISAKGEGKYRAAKLTKTAKIKVV